MATVDVSDGVIVTSGEFIEEAEALSKEKALTLISGDELSKMLGRKVPDGAVSVSELGGALGFLSEGL